MIELLCPLCGELHHYDLPKLSMEQREYTLHSYTIFSDWYNTVEEAQTELNRHILEESMCNDLQFEGEAREQIEKLRKEDGAV